MEKEKYLVVFASGVAICRNEDDAESSARTFHGADESVFIIYARDGDGWWECVNVRTLWDTPAGFYNEIMYSEECWPVHDIVGGESISGDDAAKLFATLKSAEERCRNRREGA